MATTKITTHSADALLRLPEKIKNKTNLNTLLNALQDPIQDIENALFEVFTERYLDLAEGVQLDTLGEVVGEPRNGLSDADYVKHLNARIAVNKSRGVIEDLLIVAPLIEDTTGAKFIIEQQFPAGVCMDVQDIVATPSDMVILAQFLSETVAAGVRFLLKFSEDTADEMFTFAPLAIVDGAHGSGVAIINVASTAKYPASGAIDLDTAESNEELALTYTHKELTKFYLSGTTANAHSDLEFVVLSEGVTGKGYGDESVGATGGKYAAGIE